MQRRAIDEAALIDARRLVQIVRTTPASANDKEERKSFLLKLSSPHLIRVGGARVHDHVVRDEISGSPAFIDDDGNEIVFPFLEFARACQTAYLVETSTRLNILHLVE